jgi:5-(carboxyamino)imidazole ribonucleotide mutase
LGGLDSLLSIVQMPGGVPVATMAIGRAGAVNAALFAAQILSVSDERIAALLAERKETMRQTVLRSSAELEGLS